MGFALGFLIGCLPGVALCAVVIWASDGVGHNPYDID